MLAELQLPHFGVLNGHRNFPGGPVVKTSLSNAGAVVSIPGPEAKIPHAPWPKKPNIKWKQYCNKFNKKNFKNGSHKKILKEKKLVINIQFSSAQSISRI